MDKKRSFTDTDGTFSGIIRGITDSGELKIEKESGHMQNYSFKEVTFLNHPIQ